MKLLTFVAGLAGALAFGTASAVTSASLAQDYKLTLAHHYPKTHPQGRGYEMWAEEVSANSNGRIRVRTHPARSLISGREAFKAVKTGSVHVSNMIGGFQSGNMPFINGYHLPFLFDDADHFRRTLDNGLFDLIAGEYEKNGIKLLNIFHKGATHVFHKNKFLMTPADFKGANIRGLGGYLTLMLEALGANAVTLPPGEVNTALQRGVVQGVLTNCPGHISRGWSEEAPHVSYLDLAQSSEGIGINLKLFNSMPGDLQKVIRDASKKMAEFEWKIMNEGDAVGCFEKWKKMKLPYKVITPAQRAILRQQTQPLSDKAMKEVPRINEILALVEKNRK